MKIDFKKEPPLFKVSETHYAATWLLDKRAPKVEMPLIVKTRIEASLAANKARMNKQESSNEENADQSNKVAVEGQGLAINHDLQFEEHEEEVLKEAKQVSSEAKGGKR